MEQGSRGYDPKRARYPEKLQELKRKLLDIFGHSQGKCNVLRRTKYRDSVGNLVPAVDAGGRQP